MRYEPHLEIQELLMGKIPIKSVNCKEQVEVNLIDDREN